MRRCMVTGWTPQNFAASSIVIRWRVVRWARGMTGGGLSLGSLDGPPPPRDALRPREPSAGQGLSATGPPPGCHRGGRV